MKIKEKLKAHASKIAAAVTGGAVMIAGAVPALAADGSNLTEDFKTALSTAFSTVKSDAVSLMTLAFLQLLQLWVLLLLSSWALNSSKSSQTVNVKNSDFIYNTVRIQYSDCIFLGRKCITKCGNVRLPGTLAIALIGYPLKSLGVPFCLNERKAK